MLIDPLAAAEVLEQMSLFSWNTLPFIETAVLPSSKFWLNKVLKYLTVPMDDRKEDFVEIQLKKTPNLKSFYGRILTLQE